jgi:hypothetical protein
MCLLLKTSKATSQMAKLFRLERSSAFKSFLVLPVATCSSAKASFTITDVVMNSANVNMSFRNNRCPRLRSGKYTQIH